MSEDPQTNRNDDNLASVTDKVEKGVSAYFRKNPEALPPLAVAVIVLILSPLFTFWMDGGEGKDWSETVKNVVESVAVLGGLFAVFKWVNERRDRATDILFKLDEKFADVKDGKELVDDDGEYSRKTAPSLEQSINQRVFDDTADQIDEFLDFYILLHGVRQARQVPDAPLSVCFRYWLAYYFHKDRKEFRRYVDKFYPTLARWLQEDCRQGLPFFRPHRLFGEDAVKDAIKECCENPLP